MGNALTDLRALTGEVQSVKAAVGLSQGYVRVSGVQYRRGLTTYLTVTDAERTSRNKPPDARPNDEPTGRSEHSPDPVAGRGVEAG